MSNYQKKKPTTVRRFDGFILVGYNLNTLLIEYTGKVTYQFIELRTDSVFQLQTLIVAFGIFTQWSCILYILYKIYKKLLFN